MKNHLSLSKKPPTYLFAIILFVFAGCSSTITSNTDQPSNNMDNDPIVEPTLILQEDFELPKDGGLYAKLNRHSKLTVVEGAGFNSSIGLEATYVGYDRGSERIVLEYPLGKEVTESTLCYDVRFGEGFQFVRGGKIMGLGPDNKVTGGNAVTPDGWSARSNFAAEGGVHTYVYSQNKKGKWGDSVHSDRPVFNDGEYHRVTLQVQLNDPANVPNGTSRIYVDGELQVTHKKIQFRGVPGESTQISTLLFETFHGGNTPNYAPRDKNGNYATVKAYFDNIEVYDGLHVCKFAG